MNVQQLAAITREHWKREAPETYRKMVKNKVLVEKSEAVAKLALTEMETLMRDNMAEQEAWQASLHLFILVSKEQIEKSYQLD